MRKLTLIAAMAVTFTAPSFAGEETIVKAGHMRASHVIDEFSEEVTTCGLYIGDTGRKNAWMLVINSGSHNTMMGQAGNFTASGYMMKVDKGDVYKKGREYAGGDAVYGTMTEAMLDELANGKKVVIRSHPDNQFADSYTNKYDLTGSAKVVAAYRKCAAGLK